MNNVFLSEDSAQTQGSRATPGSKGGGRLLRQTFIVALVLVSSGLLTGSAEAEERTYPIKIGVLTASWGPTPQRLACGTVCWSWAIARTSSSFSASASPKEIWQPFLPPRAS